MLKWVIALMERMGSVGVGLLMFGENVFPPIPSLLIMPFAGALAARGELSLFWVIVCGTTGSVLGGLLWYYVGLWIGAQRLKRWVGRNQRWLTISPEEVDRACDWFERWGRVAVFVGRFIPAVRTLISVPAGIARMPLAPFLFYSTLGAAIWTALLAIAGYTLREDHARVFNWVKPVSNLVVTLLVLWYLYRVVTFARGERGR